MKINKDSRKIFERRRATIKKKAGELSSRCNADVCVLCFGPDGDFDAWPEDPAKAASVIVKYTKPTKPGSKCKRREELKLSDITTAKIKDLQRRLDVRRTTTAAAKRIGAFNFPLWDEQLALLPEDSLLGLSYHLEFKIHAINSRIESLTAKQIIEQGFLQQENCLSLPTHSQECNEQLLADPMPISFGCDSHQPNTCYCPTMDETVCYIKYEDFGVEEFKGCSLLDKLPWTEPFCFAPSGCSLEYYGFGQKDLYV